MGEKPAFLASIITLIGRHADEHAAQVHTADRDSPELLGAFNDRVEAVLADYHPPGPRRGEGLVFEDFYGASDKPAADEENWRVPSALFDALLGAEVEFRGPLRLSPRQNLLLADRYEQLGAQLTVLPHHAALVFRRAAALYRINEDAAGQDRCGLAIARARTRGATGWRRMLGLFSDALCGYGYRPFLLLGWVAVQLVVFMTLAVLIVGAPSWTESIYMGATSFLNPLGPGDTAGLRAAARPLFVVESWAGTLSMSVFFALLVRKWFRM